MALESEIVLHDRRSLLIRYKIGRGQILLYNCVITYLIVQILCTDSISNSVLQIIVHLTSVRIKKKVKLLSPPDTLTEMTNMEHTTESII